MRILLCNTSALTMTASGRNVTRSRTKIAFNVARIRALRQHVIVFSTTKTASAQFEATVLFTPSTSIRRSSILLLILVGVAALRGLGGGVAMGRRGSGFAGLFVAFNLAVKLEQSRVLNGTEFSLERRVGGANLEHHVHPIGDGNGCPVRLVDEREEFVPEFDDALLFVR